MIPLNQEVQRQAEPDPRLAHLARCHPEIASQHRQRKESKEEDPHDAPEGAGFESDENTAPISDPARLATTRAGTY
jgi:hypothetical protein